MIILVPYIYFAQIHITNNQLSGYSYRANDVEKKVADLSDLISLSRAQVRYYFIFPPHSLGALMYLKTKTL